MLAAPIGGALFDANGARPLYAFATAGYAIGAANLMVCEEGEASNLPKQLERVRGMVL